MLLVVLMKDTRMNDIRTKTWVLAVALLLLSGSSWGLGQGNEYYVSPTGLPSGNVPALVEPPSWRLDPYTGIPRYPTTREFAVFVLRTR